MEDMVLENVVSIDSLCRTCMRHDDGENMLSLFDSVVTMGEGVLTPLSQMLGDFIRMEVTNIDELPKKICLNCVEHVKQSFIFWQQCRSSFHSLKQLIRPSVDCEVDPNEKCTQTDSVSLHQCEMCDKFFSDYEEMKKHRMHHKSDGFRCKFCGKSYTRLSYLKGHMAVVHTSSQVPATSFSKKCCCPVCGKQFTRPEHMRRHMLLHENGFEMKPEEELTPSDDNVDFGDDHHQADDDFVEEVDAKNNLTMPEVHIIEDPTEAQISSVPVGDVVHNDENVNKDEDSQYVPEDDQTEFTEIDESDKSTTKTSSKSKAPLTNDKQCPECNKMFTRATHLRRHMTVHTDVKAFNCNVCHKGFTRSDHLHIHMRNHTGEHPFRCEPCNKEFKRRERHTAHMKKYHATDKVTSTTGKVTSNVTVDPATVCNVCQKPFSSVKYMKIHAKTHIDNFTCKTCSIKCENRSELQKHVKTHINERPFLCSECGLRFVRADYLVVHMRRHKGEKPYKCKFCNKGFPRATDLTVHERYHTGEKTHLCTICGKGFQRAYNLLVHMRIHTGEKPYHCPHCVKSFAQGNDLKAHIRRHTGERYKCDKCDAGFIQGYHLTQHKRTVHNLDVKSHIRRVEKFISTDAKEELNEEDDEMVAGDVNDCEQREYDIIENFIEEPIHIKMEPTASGHIEPNSMDETTSYHSEEVPVSIYYIRETK